MPFRSSRAAVQTRRLAAGAQQLTNLCRDFREVSEPTAANSLEGPSSGPSS